MNQPDLFDSGERLRMPKMRQQRDAGMQKATDHAEAKVLGWTESALDMLRLYLKGHSEPFATLEFRHWLRDHHPRFNIPTTWAFGSVMARARRLGIVVQCGVKNMGDDSSHLKASMLWKGTTNV